LPTLSEVVEYVIRVAFSKGYMIGTPHAAAYRRVVERGDDIPDFLLPGRVIMELPAEIRSRVKELTAKHFQHWIK